MTYQAIKRLTSHNMPNMYFMCKSLTIPGNRSRWGTTTHLARKSPAARLNGINLRVRRYSAESLGEHKSPKLFMNPVLANSRQGDASCNISAGCERKSWTGDHQLALLMPGDALIHKIESDDQLRCVLRNAIKRLALLFFSLSRSQDRCSSARSLLRPFWSDCGAICIDRDTSILTVRD